MAKLCGRQWRHFVPHFVFKLIDVYEGLWTKKSLIERLWKKMSVHKDETILKDSPRALCTDGLIEIKHFNIKMCTNCIKNSISNIMHKWTIISYHGILYAAHFPLAHEYILGARVLTRLQLVLSPSGHCCFSECLPCKLINPEYMLKTKVMRTKTIRSSAFHRPSVFRPVCFLHCF